jgi:phage terminase large subunit
MSITVDTGILCWAWFEEAYQIETFDKFSTVVESIRGSSKPLNSIFCPVGLYVISGKLSLNLNKWATPNWLGANILVVRRFSNTNKQSTYTDLKWATNQLGVAHLFKFNESLPEITYQQ